MKSASDGWKKEYAELYPRTKILQTAARDFALRNYKRKVSNQKFAKENTEFQEACSNAGVEPTPRQASKFRNKTGKAYTQGRNK